MTCMHAKGIGVRGCVGHGMCHKEIRVMPVTRSVSSDEFLLHWLPSL